MKSLRGYFKNGIAEKKAKAAGNDTNLPTLDPNVIPHRRLTSRSGSSFAAGSFRNDEEIKNMKTEVMAEWLYKQQRLKLWASSNPDEGIILKRSRGEYTCCPEDLRYVRGGLFEQICAMNVACAMTISTNVISIFVSSQQGDTASLQGGLSVQILPNINYLSGCLKHQFAAFIRDRQMLVVWDDDPEKIIEHTARLESLLMVTIWNDGANYADAETEKEVATEKIDEIRDMEDLGIGLGYEKPRKRMLLNSFMVALTMILIMASLGLGWRKLAVEVSVDGSYIRLALAVTAPLLFFVGLFMMQSIAGCLCQILGPVNQVMMNSKAYSGKPPRRIISGPFPHVTIQMPVYKEGLNAVIRPTVMSIKAAISTYELQGGTANIFINDDGMQVISAEDAAKRQEFYEEHGIGWVSRPRHNPRTKKSPADFDISKEFNRKGKFKKASNMNYALMVSNKVEDKLANISRHPEWNKNLENEAYKQCFAEVLEELNGKAWAAGNIRVGDYILIIDSDTRVPTDCLLDAASEMEQSPEVAIMQFSSGVMKVTNSYFENGITFFTNLIYTAIRYAVASGDVCPFVGHNAILRWSALQQITYTDEDGYEKFWSESHVSEDFDMALRLQCVGYHIRLAAYQGDGFKEGVSLTVYDELARWEKYAYGCNELLFHPIRFWIFRGPFTPLFKKFMASNMPIGAKLTIMSYIATYYAIGAGWLWTLANYFIMGWYAGYVDQFWLDSFAIYVTVTVVFSGVGNVALAVLRYRTSEKGLLASLWENFTWIPLLTIFLGGISMHISQALLSHMFEIDMTWGATTKEAESTTFFVELPRLLKKFRITFLFCFACIGLMIAGVYLFPPLWRINQLVAIWPLAVMVTGHMLLPVVLNPALMMFTW